MENVTDRTSNPFGMRIDGRAVYGYGDANADFHVVGDRPGVHGGSETGVPFTESAAGKRVRSVLREVDLLADPESDSAAAATAEPDGGASTDSNLRVDGGAPEVRNLFLSYAHPKVAERPPDDASYADMERFLDAELRAINAHVILPVGDRALRYALEEHTSSAAKLPVDAAELHARQIRGRGFLVVPVADPVEWVDGDRAALLGVLRSLLDSDYRQTKGVATTVG